MIRRGFTLIELLVVITILAILAGAALPYVQNYVAESRIAKAKTDLEEIARALAVYETREGEYTKTTVADLTGRYLNKAPIDPWGQAYIIATASGLVVSAGPDRASNLTNANDSKNADNIQVPYQPPLALVSAKWVDRNQSGAVDTQNTKDTIQLTFSRILGTTVANLQTTPNTTKYFKLSSTNFINAFNPATLKIVASRTLVYELAADGIFVAGSDTITIKDGHNDLVDSATNKCIASQSVLILPQ